MSRSRTLLPTHRWTDAGAGDLTLTPRIRSQECWGPGHRLPRPSRGLSLSHYSNLSSLINTAAGDGTCHISQWHVHSSGRPYLYPLCAFSCDRINWHFSLEDCRICMIWIWNNFCGGIFWIMLTSDTPTLVGARNILVSNNALLFWAWRNKVTPETWDHKRNGLPYSRKQLPVDKIKMLGKEFMVPG